MRIDFQRSFSIKVLAVGLSILLLTGNLAVYSGDSQWQGLFNRARLKYLQGEYKIAVENLKQLLSFLGQDSEEKEFRGQIYLLMGAAYEKSGSLAMARENFRKARDVSENISIEDIDLSQLVEYQRIFLGVQNPQKMKVIERPAQKPKSKRISLLIIIAGVLVVGGIVAAMLLQKKNTDLEHKIEKVPDYDINELGIEWVKIPAGDFMMGDNFNEGDNDEQPVHRVYLSTYYISKYEITFEQYEKFCQELLLPFPDDEGWGRGKRPVINIPWTQAKAFSSWLADKTNKEIKLPTEAQWEKAARGTDQRRYPWGNFPPNCNLTNHCCSNQTRRVGIYPAGVSPYGVHDMAGNAAEWCRDYYTEDYYEWTPGTDPVGPITNYRYLYPSAVVRGGSFRCPGDYSIRAADRGFKKQYNGYMETDILLFNDVGFRIVLEAD